MAVSCRASRRAHRRARRARARARRARAAAVRRARAGRRARDRQDAAAGRARRRAPTRAAQLVLTGSASELERDLPFWVFVDALDEYVRGLEPRRARARSDDDARAELGARLARRCGARRAARARDARALPHRTAPCASCSRRSRRTKPLVLILDDLHWADSGSLELLGVAAAPPAGRARADRARGPPAPGARSGSPARSSARARPGTLDPARARRR